MILIHNEFYNDIDSMKELIKDLDFIDNPHGLVLPEFNWITEDHSTAISDIMRLPVKLDEINCVFKKYNNEINFDIMSADIDLVAMIAFGDSEITFFKHNTGNVHYMGVDPSTYDNSLENFEVVNSITLKKNDMIIFNPYLFRAIDSELVQTIYFKIIQD